MYQHMNDQEMTVFGDGTQTRAFSYIGDCLEPLYRAGSSKKASKQIINLELPLITELKKYYYQEINPKNKKLIRKGLISIQKRLFIY